jgi:8-oxo-dGTP pyrophosphatase MutT (NUDIX family)
MSTRLKAAHRLLSHKIGEEWKQGVRGYHQAVGCLLMARDTRNFSFQLRSPTSDTPNTYGSWGGSVDGAEDLSEALRRELQEETGYEGEMTIYPLLPNRDLDRGFTYYNHLVIVPKQFEIRSEAGHEDESSGDVWVPYKQWPTPLHPGLKTTLECPHTQFTLEQLFRRLNRGDQV